MKFPQLLWMLVLLCIPTALALDVVSVEVASDVSFEEPNDVVLVGGEELDVRVRLENTGEVDLEDVQIFLEIVDEEAESKEEDMEVGDKERFDLNVHLPEILEDDVVTLEISVEVDGDEVLSESYDIEVRKYKHRLRIVDHRILPQEVLCGETTHLELDVLNVGDKDEEDVRVHIAVDDFNFDMLSESFESDKGDDSYTVHAILQVPKDAIEGDYSVEVSPRYKFAKRNKEQYVFKLPVRCAPEKVIEVEEEPKLRGEVTLVKLPAHGVDHPSITGNVIAVEPDTVYGELVVFSQVFAVELFVITATLLSLVLSMFYVVSKK